MDSWHVGPQVWEPKTSRSALQGKDRGERVRLFTEGSVLNFHGGLAEKGAFVIVMPDGTRMEQAGGVAFIITAEAEEEPPFPSGLGV